MKSLLVTLSLVFAMNAFACTEDGSGGFLPDNDLNIPVGMKTGGGITEAEFNGVIDMLEKIYIPIVKDMGGKLKVARKWDDGTVNANASRFLSTWNVNMYGGLARHQETTPDAFAMVLCHEIGHHLGGAPKVGGFMQKWASNEGQSDYFAGLKCLRRAFENDDNEEIVSKMQIPEFVVNKCSASYAARGEQAMCQRISMAGLALAKLLASLRSSPTPQFDSPDRSIVDKTDDAHPAAQCRLDTYFNGALCDKALSDEVDQKDEVKGTCHPKNGDKVGLRPLCWFKPTL
ncbi:MAG: hypothetical protein K2P81_10370 [Bacteriovoracaceae bacterium]|nr:hypothetical protein [Bacteriovoracaceae bacterium]